MARFFHYLAAVVWTVSRNTSHCNFQLSTQFSFQVYNFISNFTYQNDDIWYPVGDPGFPVWGAPSRWGGANLRCGHFLTKMYAKTKELDPVGGGGGAPEAPPGSANDTACRFGFKQCNLIFIQFKNMKFARSGKLCHNDMISSNKTVH